MHETFETKNNDGNVIERYLGKKQDGIIIKDGNYEKWYDNGIKAVEGEYFENSKYGIWTYWYESGNIWKTGEYVQDKEVGEWKSFNDIISEPEKTIEPVIEEKVIEDKPFLPRKDLFHHSYHEIREQYKTAEKPPEIHPHDHTLTERINPRIVIFGIAGIITIVLLVWLFFSLGKKQVSEDTADTDTTSVQASVAEMNKVISRFNEWISLTNKKNIKGVMQMYDNNVDYYTWGVINKTRVQTDKTSFFNRWNVVKISGKITAVQKQNGDKYRCLYDKQFSMESTGGKKSSGKVKSSLVFQEKNDKLLIVYEKDDSPVR